ncbi:glycosyltransferase [Ruminococcus sp. AF31-14BH]|jgi:glycosyltransferase involved in cell wall biosynthesis|nr:glycosyltransferase [Ruminococcus sp. AF31-14BH]
MSENKQSVLMVHNYYQIPGGEDTVVANEKKMLEKHGHKVVLYTRNNAELKTMNLLQKMLLPFTTIFNPKTYREIKKIIKKEKIDIVHVHNTLNLVSPSVYYAAKVMKVPVVQTIHNFRLLCPGATFYRDGHICEDCVSKGLMCAVKHKCYRESRLQTLACVISTKIHRLTGIYGKINYICLTEFNKKKLLELKQIKEEQVFVKPNFVESIGEFIPEEERVNQFIFVGRLDKLKGIDLLLKAWEKMGEDAPKLIVCGTGPMEEWCKAYVADNELNIEMRGFVSNVEARKEISRSIALVLPTQLYEGFPMGIVEAFSVGTPVLCSDLGNAGSAVEENVTGYKFNQTSEREIINAIKKMGSTSLDNKKIINIFNQKYSMDANYSILDSIYDFKFD